LPEGGEPMRERDGADPELGVDPSEEVEAELAAVVEGEGLQPTIKRNQSPHMLSLGLSTR